MQSQINAYETCKQAASPVGIYSNIKLLEISRKSYTSVKNGLRFWYRNWRTRKQLLALSSQDLKDIGITRVDALQEAQKPFWHS